MKPIYVTKEEFNKLEKESIKEWNKDNVGENSMPPICTLGEKEGEKNINKKAVLLKGKVYVSTEKVMS